VTTANPDDESRDRVTACLISSVPGLDDGAARDVLATAGAGHGRALHEIDALLKEHPGALVTTPTAYPLVLVRLAHALIDAGYLAVTPPACAGCGKITADLRRRTASGRVCGTCAARDSKGTCARCGQAKRIYARRPEGGICSACYDKDEQVVTECSGCGRTRKIARRATASTPDVCYSCYQGASATCSVCGETRPCQRVSSGSPICRSCRTRPPRPCFRCGRNRPVQAEWPAGPVCSGCYEHVRRHPAECAGCGAVRPLIGSNDQGRPVCGPCAGTPELDYTCRECGRGGEIHSGGRCFGCVLAERAHALLAGPSGEVSAQLRPLFTALTTVTNPLPW